MDDIKRIVVKDGDKEITCNVLFVFKNNNDNYIVYEEDEEVLASKYMIQNNEIVLKDIEKDEEWDLIDEKLSSYYED